ncbi:hypothetical protein K1T73_03535 [Roseovarius sp. SCSIO 43702]|uniref:hypothetical protein n=1 Tax=Roseovarius sp. SCSIO 43702 TaxID=2823043 RepID=UPI001C73763C|nr:hypothetical protein [Roseovarius sp. SCSIO 43702]QYX57485.1 hypothetical protein K1T73_03535 [Roseovarius sp. SCSIO 43702]
MPLPAPASERFTTQSGLRVSVQVPETHTDRLLAAVLAVDGLTYGDYDRVSFSTAPGRQSFRSLGTGRNPATPDTVEVPCVELSLFLADETRLTPLLEALYHAHPYEEPVIFVTPAIRTRHKRGLDEDNPNRFWNGPPQDWVPPEHR